MVLLSITGLPLLLDPVRGGNQYIVYGCWLCGYKGGPLVAKGKGKATKGDIMSLEPLTV
jgi:hypothetical protein